MRKKEKIVFLTSACLSCAKLLKKSELGKNMYCRDCRAMPIPMYDPDLADGFDHSSDEYEGPSESVI